MAHALFLPRTPGLQHADATTGLSPTTETPTSLSLYAAMPHTAAPWRPLVVRHAFAKLQLSAPPPDPPPELTNLGFGGAAATGGGAAAARSNHALALLAADATWTLAPPSDASCGGRARRPDKPPPQAALAADAQVSTAVTRLATPTHRVTLGFAIGSAGQTTHATFVLYGHLLPKTVSNFVELCGGKVPGKSYVGSKMQRIMPGFMAQGGSTVDGGYGESAKGGKFADESFALSHDAKGVLSMANAGPDTNGSQFFIVFNPQPHLDGKHVVFGRLVDDGGAGTAALRALEAVGSASGTTTVEVRIATCDAMPTTPSE